MQQFMLGLLDICPLAADIQVGPFRYCTTHQVFPRRPGAGWMLYLPTVISSKELPEAAELVPVMADDRQKGTIIVSVFDRVFSVENPDHVKIANAIEIRLADQDLLPR
ncbi:Imm52 family immunity protein [Trinickia dinghuensis]|nr:Imm52 family immunity protein [Trinickia dinghuensis]